MDLSSIDYKLAQFMVPPVTSWTNSTEMALSKENISEMTELCGHTNPEGLQYKMKFRVYILYIYLDLTKNIGPLAGIEPAALRFRCSALTNQ